MLNIIGKDTGNIQYERVKPLNNRKIYKGDYIIYWMQTSQRTEYNHALEYSILTANSMSLPVIVYFRLTANFLEANGRHYHFLLQGLQEVQASLKSKPKTVPCVVIRVPSRGIAPSSEIYTHSASF